ncbi:MAG TPA: NADP-dependent isocitrate dehydrogenase, partial [Allosphingosinicella sp.]|nr:NADP-dependent isocitrate dehydrogenase [Allosphingosinicella sp.]
MNVPLSGDAFQKVSGAPAPLPVAVAFGDGIGPEIMEATLRVLDAAGASLDLREVRLGEALYRAGHSSGMDEAAWSTIDSTGLLLKAPITTPLGGGVKSLNVTLRKTLGLYANVRPAVAYAPFVPTLHPGMDVTVVRENEEDLYAGIEHRQTTDVYQCLKLVSRSGTERIVRHAFEHARAHGRLKITCVTKSNIMKLTDGLFDEVFEEIGAQYPDIEQERMIVDIAAAKLAADPTRFDVIVTTNLYGDILSDIAAEVAGSVGLAPSANIGASAAMFEAIHGSAPDIAGQDVANPSGLLLAAVMMLRHGGQDEAAGLVHNAWLKTIEDGLGTPDMLRGKEAAKRVGTRGLADAVIARLGEEPARLRPAPTAMPCRSTDGPPVAESAARKTPFRSIVGVDVFVNAPETSPDALGEQLRALEHRCFKLQMITNRGVKVWPGSNRRTLLTDHWRCRFITHHEGPTNRTMVA